MKTLNLLGLLAALTFSVATVAQAGESCCKPGAECCVKDAECCKK